jgi:hypothetical protein
MDELYEFCRATRLNRAKLSPACWLLRRMKSPGEDEDHEKRGVIRGYQAILNEDELDLEKVTAVIEVKVTPQREGGFDTIAERISRFPEVRSAYLMSGTYDLLLFVEGGPCTRWRASSVSAFPHWKACFPPPPISC